MLGVLKSFESFNQTFVSPPFNAQGPKRVYASIPPNPLLFPGRSIGEKKKKSHLKPGDFKF